MSQIRVGVVPVMPLCLHLRICCLSGQAQGRSLSGCRIPLLAQTDRTQKTGSVDLDPISDTLAMRVHPITYTVCVGMPSGEACMLTSMPSRRLWERTLCILRELQQFFGRDHVRVHKDECATCTYSPLTPKDRPTLKPTLHYCSDLLCWR